MSEDNAFAMFRRQTLAQFAAGFGFVLLALASFAALWIVSPN